MDQPSKGFLYSSLDNYQGIGMADPCHEKESNCCSWDLGGSKWCVKQGSLAWPSTGPSVSLVTANSSSVFDRSSQSQEAILGLWAWLSRPMT